MADERNGSIRGKRPLVADRLVGLDHQVSSAKPSVAGGWDLPADLDKDPAVIPQLADVRVPPGEVYEAIESPRGELGCFVLADGSSKPARVHMRDPSFINLGSLPDMARGELIADLIAGIAMLDPILGGIDR